jgi:ribosomal protein S18 acetylase RimI-like enzyme
MNIEVISYSPEYKADIKQLNVEWLNKYFSVEPNDELQLSNPQEEIIDKGGLIFYSKYNGEIVGTATLLKVNSATYELSKMAVTAKAQGQGIGKKLLEHCIKVAKQNQTKYLILYSNTKLEAALNMYRKSGFVEMPFSNTGYARANIKMQLSLTNPSRPNFNGKTFALVQNSDNGKVNTDTVFKYKQEENLVTADYYGGSILCFINA